MSSATGNNVDMDDEDDARYHPVSPLRDDADDKEQARQDRQRALTKIRAFFQDVQARNLDFPEFLRSAFAPTSDEAGYSDLQDEIYEELQAEFTSLYQRHVRTHYPDVARAIHYIHDMPAYDKSVLKAWVQDSKPLAEKSHKLNRELARIYQNAPRFDKTADLYRGIGGGAARKMHIGRIDVQQDRLMSTTYNRSVARTFGADLLLTIEVPAHVSFLLLETDVFRRYGFKNDQLYGLGYEQEVLLPPNGLLLRNVFDPWHAVFVADPATFQQAADLVVDQQRFYDVALHLSHEREQHIRDLYKQVRASLPRYREERPGYYGENKRLTEINKECWLWYLRTHYAGKAHASLVDTWRELSMVCSKFETLFRQHVWQLE